MRINDLLQSLEEDLVSCVNAWDNVDFDSFCTVWDQHGLSILHYLCPPFMEELDFCNALYGTCFRIMEKGMLAEQAQLYIGAFFELYILYETMISAKFPPYVPDVPDDPDDAVHVEWRTNLALFSEMRGIPCTKEWNDMLKTLYEQSDRFRVLAGPLLADLVDQDAWVYHLLPPQYGAYENDSFMCAQDWRKVTQDASSEILEEGYVPPDSLIPPSLAVDTEAYLQARKRMHLDESALSTMLQDLQPDRRGTDAS